MKDNAKNLMERLNTFSVLKDVEIQALLDLLSVYRKRASRLGVFLYLFPILYLLIENSVEVKINFTFFDMVDSNIIKLLFPSFYGILFFYFFHTTSRTRKVIDLIKVWTEESLYKKEWINIIRPRISADVLMENFSLSNFSTYVLLIPFFIIVFLSPMGFFVYTVYKLGILASLYTNSWYWVFFGFNIWLFIGIAYYMTNPTEMRKRKRKRKNRIEEENKSEENK